jgi:hypothetical protein
MFNHVDKNLLKFSLNQGIHTLKQRMSLCSQQHRRVRAAPYRTQGQPYPAQQNIIRQNIYHDEKRRRRAAPLTGNNIQQFPVES